MKGEADALRREINEWRDRAGVPRVEEPPRGEGFGMVLAAEMEAVPVMSVDDEEEDEEMLGLEGAQTMLERERALYGGAGFGEEEEEYVYAQQQQQQAQHHHHQQQAMAHQHHQQQQQQQMAAQHLAAQMHHHAAAAAAAAACIEAELKAGGGAKPTNSLPGEAASPPPKSR